MQLDNGNLEHFIGPWAVGFLLSYNGKVLFLVMAMIAISAVVFILVNSFQNMNLALHPNAKRGNPSLDFAFCVF